MVDQSIPIHDLAKSLEEGAKFSLQKLEKSYPSYNASRAHRHTYFELVFFKESGGTHEIDFEEFAIQAFDIHVVAPQQVHILRREPQVSGYVISFTEDVFLSIGLSIEYLRTLLFFQPINFNPIISLNDSACKIFFEMVAELERESKHMEVHHEEAIALLLSKLLLLLKRYHNPSSKEKSYNPLTTEFIRLLQLHYQTISHVQVYAEMLHVSAGHLNEVVKLNTHKTAKALIQDYLLLESKRLLAHSMLSIKQIALHLNFADSSYFTRFFKVHTGLSPIAFRNSIREK